MFFHSERAEVSVMHLAAGATKRSDRRYEGSSTHSGYLTARRSVCLEYTQVLGMFLTVVQEPLPSLSYPVEAHGRALLVSRLELRTVAATFVSYQEVQMTWACRSRLGLEIRGCGVQHNVTKKYGSCTWDIVYYA